MAGDCPIAHEASEARSGGWDQLTTRLHVYYTGYLAAGAQPVRDPAGQGKVHRRISAVPPHTACSAWGVWMVPVAIEPAVTADELCKRCWA